MQLHHLLPFNPNMLLGEASKKTEKIRVITRMLKLQQFAGRKYQGSFVDKQIPCYLFQLGQTDAGKQQQFPRKKGAFAILCQFQMLCWVSSSGRPEPAQWISSKRRVGAAVAVVATVVIKCKTIAKVIRSDKYKRNYMSLWRRKSNNNKIKQ